MYMIDQGWWFVPNPLNKPVAKRLSGDVEQFDS
jgi:hypothetical protein